MAKEQTKHPICLKVGEEGYENLPESEQFQARMDAEEIANNYLRPLLTEYNNEFAIIVLGNDEGRLSLINGVSEPEIMPIVDKFDKVICDLADAGIKITSDEIADAYARSLKAYHEHHAKEKARKARGL